MDMELTSSFTPNFEHIRANAYILRHRSGGMPGGCDFRVEVDHEVLLLGQLRIAGLDLGEDPVAEAVSEQGVGDVDDPLLRDLQQFLLDRHVLLEFLVVAHARHDIFQRQAFILRKVQVVDRRTLDVLLLAGYEVLQETANG